MDNSKKEHIRKAKISRIHDFLLEVYKESHEGYVKLSLSKIALAKDYKNDISALINAVLNIKILTKIGGGNTVQYFWKSPQYPSIAMAEKVLNEIDRMHINKNLNKEVDEKISKSNLIPIIKKEEKPKNDITNHMHYESLQLFLSRYMYNPVHSFNKALKEFNLTPIYGIVINKHGLINESKYIKYFVTPEIVIMYAKLYWSKKSSQEIAQIMAPIISEAQNSRNETQIASESEPAIKLENIETKVVKYTITSEEVATKSLIEDLKFKKIKLLEEIAEIENVITAYEIVDKYAKKSNFVIS